MGEWVKLYNGIHYRLRSIFVGFVQKNACYSDTPWVAYVWSYSRSKPISQHFSSTEEAKAFVETTAALVLGE